MGGGGGGEDRTVVAGRQSSKSSKVGRKINTKMKKCFFLSSTIFKLLRQITGHSINNSGSFKVYNFC